MFSILLVYYKQKHKMAQINFSIKDELNKKLEEVSKKMGLAKSDYIKSLIIEDLKKYILKGGKK